jgi:hypothetical protein
MWTFSGGNGGSEVGMVQMKAQLLEELEGPGEGLRVVL